MTYKIPSKNKKVIEEFESIRDNAELRAYSKISLERPLTDKEYDRMNYLAKKLGYK
jgi:hypothetical protein